jgi:hypothetical protein
VSDTLIKTGTQVCAFLSPLSGWKRDTVGFDSGSTVCPLGLQLPAVFADSFVVAHRVADIGGEFSILFWLRDPTNESCRRGGDEWESLLRRSFPLCKCLVLYYASMCSHSASN